MKQRHLYIFALAVLAPLLTLAAPKGDERVSLFNGKSLDGWSVLKCEARVDKGDLLLVAGNGLVQTKKKYADFVLEFEWKGLAEGMWDSGVYFRYDTVPKNKPWPPRYQVNLRKGLEGNVGGIKEAASTGLIKAGKWNKFKLTVRGDTLEMEINGKPAWKAKGLADEPKSGYIAFQAEVPQGGQHRFRKIFVTELKAAE
jgi:hypothetical protein